MLISVDCVIAAPRFEFREVLSYEGLTVEVPISINADGETTLVGARIQFDYDTSVLSNPELNCNSRISQGGLTVPVPTHDINCFPGTASSGDPVIIIEIEPENPAIPLAILGTQSLGSIRFTIADDVTDSAAGVKTRIPRSNYDAFSPTNTLTWFCDEFESPCASRRLVGFALGHNTNGGVLVVEPDRQARPSFDIGRRAGRGDSRYSIPLDFRAGDQAVSRGTVSFTFDNTALAATANCVPTIGNPPSHAVECMVDSMGGIVEARFLGLQSGNEISTDAGLGSIEFDLVGGPYEEAETFLLEAQGATFADFFDFPVTPGRTDDGYVKVVPSWPLDEFEDDDIPLSAKEMEIVQARSIQSRSFHEATDEDWLFITGECLKLSSELHVRPVDGSVLRPLVEVYGTDRLSGAVPPLATFGNCESGASPALVSVPPGVILGYNLVRVSNCLPSISEPVIYELRYREELACTQQLARVSGTVTDAGTGAPVSAFVLSSLNEFTVSSPATGDYQMFVTADNDFSLTALAQDYLPSTIDVDAIPAAQPRPDQDLVLRGPGIFTNGFE